MADDLKITPEYRALFDTVMRLRELEDDPARLRTEVERLTAHAESGWEQSRYWMDRYRVAADERDAALARVGALIGSHSRCEGCGSITDNPDAQLTWIKRHGGTSCCPERKMVRLTPIDAQAALDKLIADARADWQPIETAPRDGTRILAFVPRYGATTAHFDAHNTHRFICHSVLNRKAQPTHWLPLPEPPARINEPQEGGK